MEEAGQQQHGARQYTADGEKHVVNVVAAAATAVEEKHQVIDIAAAATPTTEAAMARALGNKVSEEARALSKEAEANAAEARDLIKQAEAVAAGARAVGSLALIEWAEAEAAWLRALGKEAEANAAVARDLLLLLVFTGAFLLWLWFDLMNECW